MATLNIASKANQATTIPALLVASYVKESSQPTSVNVNFKEVDALKSGEEASVELVVGKSVYGSENAIQSLIETYPFLQGKNDSAVCTTRTHSCHVLITNVG